MCCYYPPIARNILTFNIGGFAHVYLVRLARAANGSDIAVLKRVAVPDKEALANMRIEVETMVGFRFLSTKGFNF